MSISYSLLNSSKSELHRSSKAVIQAYEYEFRVRYLQITDTDGMPCGLRSSNTSVTAKPGRYAFCIGFPYLVRGEGAVAAFSWKGIDKVEINNTESPNETRLATLKVELQYN